MSRSPFPILPFTSKALWPSCSQNVLIIWLRNHEEGYSRNASCALILISSMYTFGIFTLFDFSCFVKMLSFEDCNVNFGILPSFHVLVQHMYFVFLSSGTTYFDLILSAYMTYIDLIMSSYMTYIDLILSAYTTFIDLILLSDTTYMAMIMSFYTTIIDLIMSSYMRYILTYYFMFIPQLPTWFCLCFGIRRDRMVVGIATTCAISAYHH